MKQGWQIKRLGEICDILNGFAFKSNEYVKEGVRVIRITNVQKGKIVDEEPKYFPVKRSNEILKYILQDGDLLMSLTGNVGRVGIISSSLLPAALNQRVACLRIKDKTISIKYLFHLLNSNLFEKDCIDSASGIAQLNMSTKWLEQYEMVIPPPSEQQRIVNLLDAECAKIDALKANAEKDLQNAKDLFQAALKKELEPKEGWKEKKIGELFETGSGGTPLKMHKEYYEGGNIPWLRSGEVCKKYITETELFITKLGLDNSSAKFFPTNTIVVAMYGATAGQVGILRMQTTTNQAVCGILPNEHYVPEFVYYSILSKQEELVSQATGNAQPNISQIKIKKLSIPVLPLSDQQSIVARLDTLDEKCKTLQANYEKTLSLCDDLKQALLRKAFNGEI